MSTRASRSHGRRFLLVLLVLSVAAVVTSTGLLKAGQSQPEKRPYGADLANVPDAIARVKSGQFGAIHVDLITRGNAIEAVPLLKDQFERVNDPLLKAKIASALVRLGDKDSRYWDHIEKLASIAVDSDIPDPVSYDAAGKALPQLSLEFVAWQRAHNIASDEQIDLPLWAVGLLGWSRDPRAVPLLRRGLLAPYFQTEIMSALGLAEIGNNDSIPLIIAACKRAPAEPAAVIAQALVYFNDPAAQTAVDTFIPGDMAKMYRDEKDRGKRTPFTIP